MLLLAANELQIVVPNELPDQSKDRCAFLLREVSSRDGRKTELERCCLSNINSVLAVLIGFEDVFWWLLHAFPFDAAGLEHVHDFAEEDAIRNVVIEVVNVDSFDVE